MALSLSESSPRHPHLLILGGTGDAYALAQEVSERGGVDEAGRSWRITTSLAGRTENPRSPAGAVRTGGFGGVDGLRSFLRDQQVTAVVDATHPFAVSMGNHAVAACAAETVPLLRWERAAWRPGAGDQWYEVSDGAAAHELLCRLAIRRVFLAVGRKDLGPFARWTTMTMVIRAVDNPQEGYAGDFARDFPLAEIVLDRGPFAEADERALFSARKIGAVVCKNAGGEAGTGKLAAARSLGIPVVMIARPQRQAAPTVYGLAEALDWLRERLGGGRV